jgi:hypothetical protein
MWQNTFQINYAQRSDIINLCAGIAQLAEQLLRKQLVGGSSPLSGTNISFTPLHSVDSGYRR